MTGKRKPIIFASFLIAAQMATQSAIAASKPDLPTTSVTPHSIHTSGHTSHSKSKPKHPELLPAGRIDLATEPHYAVVVENGRMMPLSQSAGFEPDKEVPTASITKLLTADAVLDRMGSSENLRQGILHSDNERITQAALDAVPHHTLQEVHKMLVDKVAQLGLVGRYDPVNASGYPNLPHGKRADTMASPRAMLAVIVDLMQNKADAMDGMFCNAIQVEGRTNNLYCPSGVKPDVANGEVEVMGKTGTSDGQNHSMVVAFRSGDKIYAVYHPHRSSPYVEHNPAKSDPRSPISTMAAIVLEIVKTKTDITDPTFIRLLQLDASGAIKSDDVLTARNEVPDTMLAVVQTPVKPQIVRATLHRRHAR